MMAAETVASNTNVEARRCERRRAKSDFIGSKTSLRVQPRGSREFKAPILSIAVGRVALADCVTDQ
jgi:hypothetical protein